MSHSETLVGSIAVALAFTAVAISCGPWTSPYELRSIAKIQRRFGKPTARIVWLVIAIASLSAGLAILTGVRPPYAVPPHRSQLAR